MHKRLKGRWIAVNGSILTEAEYERKADLGGKYKTRDGIAFNVGQEIAEYVVRLHNENLALRTQIAESPDKGQ